MWIVAVAWIYVVGLMSLTETSVVAGVMTFVCYCAIPLSILYYLATGKQRRLRRDARQRRPAPGGSDSTGDNQPDNAGNDGGDGD